MPGTPSHLRFCLFPLLGTARGVEVATQLGEGELKAVPKWVWVGQLPGRFGSSERKLGLWMSSGSRKHLGAWPREGIGF